MSQADPGSTTHFNPNAAPFQPGAMRSGTQNNGSSGGTEFNLNAAPFTPLSVRSGPSETSSFTSSVPAPADTRSIPLLGGFRSKRGFSASPDGGMGSAAPAVGVGSYNGPASAPVPPSPTMNRSGTTSVENSAPRPPVMNWVPPQLHKQAAMRAAPTQATAGEQSASPGPGPGSAPVPSQSSLASPTPTLTVPRPRTVYAQMANAAAAAAAASESAVSSSPATTNASPNTPAPLTDTAATRAPPAPRSRPGMYPASATSRTPAPRSQATAAAAAATNGTASTDPGAPLQRPPVVRQAPVPVPPPVSTDSSVTATPAPLSNAAGVDGSAGQPRFSPPPQAPVHAYANHTGVASPMPMNPEGVQPPRVAPAPMPTKKWVPPQAQQMERLKMMRQARHEDPVVVDPQPSAPSPTTTEAKAPAPPPPPQQQQPQSPGMPSAPPRTQGDAALRRPPPAPRPSDATANRMESPAPVPVSSALPPRTGSAPLVKTFSQPDSLNRIRRNMGTGAGGVALPSRPPADASTTAPSVPALAAKKDEEPAQTTQSSPPAAVQVASSLPAGPSQPQPPFQQPMRQPSPMGPPVGLHAPLRAHVGAVPYAPKEWVPPHVRKMANATVVRPSPTTPLVVLILGNRGSGKTTQGKALADRYNLLHLSSGNLFREGKQPYKELEDAVKKYFVDPSTCPYNGLVLDRFIVSSGADAFFVQHALNIAHLPVPMVFWLKVDPVIGQQRAAAQSAAKQGHDHWRLVEQCAQAAVVHDVYEPIDCVFPIDSEVLTQEQVAAKIATIVDTQFPRRRLIRHSLPSISPIPSDERVTIMDSYSSFIALTHHIHESIVSRGRHDSAPLSAIGGYVDASFFTDKTLKASRRTYYVTAKVDGSRFLVVKHRSYGFVGVPFPFKSCFNFNSLFEGMNFSQPPASELHPPASEDNPVEVLLDTELAIDPSGVPTLHIIDYVYFYGNIATRQVFSTRYHALKDWFNVMAKNSSREAVARCSVVLKEYVGICDLGKMLPSLNQAPFAIDGIVFQHNKKYLYGPDKALLKWKPQNQCTADFRLVNGQDEGNGTWTFQLSVSDPTDTRATDEGLYEGATAIITEQERVYHHLHNALVVELYLDYVDRDTGASQWRFGRVRADKPTPNKMAIVRHILSLDHMSYESLVAQCSTVK